MKSSADELEINEQKSIVGKKKWITPEIGVYGIAEMTQFIKSAGQGTDAESIYS